MENLPSLQALKKKLRWLKLKLRWLVGKASDGKTITEKTQKRWCSAQSQIYEEVFSSEISFVLRHWQRKEEMKFREDFRVYEDCCDDKDKKKCHSYGHSRPSSTPPPPLPPRFNPNGKRGNNDKKMSVNKNSVKNVVNYNCNPRLEHRLFRDGKKGVARKKIKFVV